MDQHNTSLVLLISRNRNLYNVSQSTKEGGVAGNTWNIGRWTKIRKTRNSKSASLLMQQCLRTLQASTAGISESSLWFLSVRWVDYYRGACSVHLSLQLTF